MTMRPGLPDSVESVPSSGRNACRDVTQPVLSALHMILIKIEEWRLMHACRNESQSSRSELRGLGNPLHIPHDKGCNDDLGVPKHALQFCCFFAKSFDNMEIC